MAILAKLFTQRFISLGRHRKPLQYITELPIDNSQNMDILLLMGQVHKRNLIQQIVNIGDWCLCNYPTGYLWTSPMHRSPQINGRK